MKNLNLRVRADGSVVMSIPWHTSLAQAQAFLDERSDWIEAHAKRRAAPAPEGQDPCAARPAADPMRPLAADDVVPLWGEAVRVGEALTGADISLQGSPTLGKLWRAEVDRALPEVVARTEVALGVHATGWQLRSMSTRWGSCTPKTGRIRINVRLAAYPRTCLDYVVAHELTHLLEPSHNERFHAILATAYPDERGARALLRRDPAELAGM